MGSRFKGRKILKWSAFLLMGLLVGIVLFVIVVAKGGFGAIPSVDQLRSIENPQASIIYSSNDKILGKYYIQNRTDVHFEEISRHVIDALVATEDVRFYSHQGVDLRSWTRVFFKTILLRDRSAGGGSTITQQLAKNLFPRKKYGILTIPVNKTKEVFAARRLEKIFSKNEILTLYLNTVPFGGTTFGLEAASRNLFSKEPIQLNIEEAAVLVGMLKGSTSYNPLNNLKKSQDRRNIVFLQMEKHGYIDQNERDSLKRLPILLSPVSDRHDEGTATYFREFLRQEVKEIVDQYNAENNTEINIYTDGLKIYTTIEEDAQKAAEVSMNKWMSKLQKQLDNHWGEQKPWNRKEIIQKQVLASNRYKMFKAKGLTEEAIQDSMESSHGMNVFSWEGDKRVKWSPIDSIKYYLGLLQAGILSAEPESGAIRAWVGGIDHQFLKYDHVQSKRQTGSVFKPIVYANALELGYSPCDYFENRLMTYVDYDDWTPENADNQYGGQYSLQGALAHSINTISVWLALESGIDRVIQLAQQMGIRSEIPNVPSISLGTLEASLFDVVQVYSTIANNGRMRPLYYLRRIIGPEGEEIYQYEPQKADQVLRPEHALVLKHMLTNTVKRGTASKLKSTYQIPGPIAAKTGTTQKHVDGWFVGITPNMVTGVWVGGDNPLVRFRSLDLGQGAYLAMPIWAYMHQNLYANPKFAKWPQKSFDDLPFEWRIEMDCEDYQESIFEPWNADDDGLLVDQSSIERLKRKQARKRHRRNKDNGLKAFFKNLFGKKN